MIPEIDIHTTSFPFVSNCFYNLILWEIFNMAKVAVIFSFFLVALVKNADASRFGYFHKWGCSEDTTGTVVE